MKDALSQEHTSKMQPVFVRKWLLVWNTDVSMESVLNVLNSSLCGCLSACLDVWLANWLSDCISISLSLSLSLYIYIYIYIK